MSSSRSVYEILKDLSEEYEEQEFYNDVSSENSGYRVAKYTQRDSEFTNSDISACERRIKGLKEELRGIPLFLLENYLEELELGIEMMESQIDKYKVLLRNETITKEEREEIEKEKTKLESKLDDERRKHTDLEDAIYDKKKEIPQSTNNEPEDPYNPSSLTRRP